MRFALAALAAVVLLTVLGAWTFYFVGTPHPQHADAIVVLSGDIAERLPTGVRLFDRHVAPNLLVSIYDRTPQGLCARRHVTCFHAHPFSTQGEAETVSRLLRAHGWNSLIIVSSRYHLRRAKMLFARCTDAKLQVTPAPTGVARYVKGVVLEIPKWAYHLTLDRDC